MNLKKTARLAGLFWLLVAITSGFSFGYVRPRMIVAGDAAATANNIMANASLFRMAIASYILAQIFSLFFGLTIFRLFREVSKTWTNLALTAMLVSVAVAVINTVNNVAALLVLSKADYLSAFGQEQLNAMMMIFLRLNNSGLGFSELFLGLYLFSFGWLIIHTGFIPKILGILLILGGLAFAVNTFTKLLIPQFNPAMFTQLAMFANALGGIPTIFWLLIKGVKEEQQISEVNAQN